MGGARFSLPGAAALLLVALADAPVAHAQFQLFLVNGSVEQPVGTIYAFGNVDTGAAATAQFRIRNTSTAAASLNLLAVSGAGFTLTAPSIPVPLNPQAAVDFSITFQAATPGAYSATLDSVGISVLLTATALPHLTYQVITAAGPQTLGAAPVDFGNVTLGSTALVQFAVLNQTAQTLTVPALAVVGADFALSGPSPAGTPLLPLQTAAFAIVFTPSAAGARSATLTAGSQIYNLTGSGVAPALPKATLAITLPQAASAQQGTVSVTLDGAAPIAASGTVSLSFQPAATGAADPAIAFASGSQTLNFTVSPGDTQASFAGASTGAFQTGTTAGTLTFTVQFGGVTSQQTVTVQPAAIGVSTVQGARQAGTITVQVTGFDNTRTAGKLVFTFYDSSGNAISPGAINADASAAFSSYFGSSGLGGVFALTAVFPVNGGAPSQVAAFDVQLVNSAGTAQTARTSF